MKDLEQRKAAKEFAERWKGKGYEKGQSQIGRASCRERV